MKLCINYKTIVVLVVFFACSSMVKAGRFFIDSRAIMNDLIVASKKLHTHADEAIKKKKLDRYDRLEFSGEEILATIAKHRQELCGARITIVDFEHELFRIELMTQEVLHALKLSRQDIAYYY